MREDLVQVGAGKGEEGERGTGPWARMGSQGSRADWLGQLSLCYRLQTDCNRVAGT